VLRDVRSISILESSSIGDRLSGGFRPSSFPRKYRVSRRNVPTGRASVHPKSGYRLGHRNMIWIANALVALVAALHVYFLMLEMFLWTKPLGLKTFGNSLEKANDSAVLAANQGLYNGFLAAGLIWGLVASIPAFAFEIKVFFLLCVIVAGVYGAVTVSRRILLVQAAPAAIALILLWLA
jgi:putative membrane protein